MRIIIIAALCLITQVSICQNRAKASLTTTISNDSVYIYEPTIVTISFDVYNDNTIPLRFADLINQLLEMKSHLPLNSWIFDKNIAEINGEVIEENNEIYTRYNLLQIAICKFDSIDYEIPSLHLYLNHIDIKNDSIVSKISFESSKKKIVVRNQLLNNIYSNDMFGMVGDFEIETNPAMWVNSIVGDTVKLKMKIKSNGMTYPLLIPFLRNDYFDFEIVESDHFYEISERGFYSERRFVYNIIFKKSGSFFINQFLPTKYFSYKKHIQDSINIPLKINISEREERIIDHNSKSQPESTVLLVDVSQSMLLEDFKPNRLTTIIQNLEEVQLENIPILVYGGEVKKINELSEIYSESESIDSGTAIGNAIWEAVQKLEFAKSENKKIILIGDGDNTTGHISISDAALLAFSKNIKIYSIGIGKKGKVPFGEDSFGRPRLIENTFSDTMLKMVSEITKGEYFQYETDESFRLLIARLIMKE